MKKVFCLISSPPNSSQIQRGLAFVQEWAKQGNEVQVFLIQDAVYAGLRENSIQENNTFSLAQWFVLDEDLKLRGFTSSDLRPEIQTINYDQLTQQMMEEADQVIGAF